MNKRQKKYKEEPERVRISEIGKLPPQAVDLEEAVLGAVLLEEDAYHQIADMFFPECFYKEQNGRICAAVIRLYDRGEKADILTVVNELKRTEELELVGGAYYVSSLTSRVASSANIEMHMRLIHEPYIKREAIRASTALIRDGYDEASDALEIIDQWEKELTTLSNQLFVRKAEDSISLFDKVLHDNEVIRAYDGSMLGIPSGFDDLDKLTGGWRPSDLIVLAARPGMGKTAMAVQMGKYAALLNKPTAIFSLEMSALQVYKRLCSQETEIPLQQFTTTGMDEGTVSLFRRDMAKLKGAPLFIDDVGGQTIFDIRTKCRKLKREKKIELIIIDYLQLIASGSERSGNREQEISQISRSLKVLAKELNLPIIALSQLTRQTENRPGTSKRPQLSDLRDSGAIEQDADQVVFIYRPEYYGILTDEDNNPTAGVAEIIIAKNRSGPLDEVTLYWKADCVLFKNMNNHPLMEAEPIVENNKFLNQKNDDLPY